VAEITLSGGHVVLVDDEDLPKLAGYGWHRQSKGYVAAMVTEGGKRKMLLLHRHLTGAPKGLLVDHRNGDPLDNRRGNLRVTTQQINQVNRKRVDSRNTSGVRGVFRARTKAERWTAKIGVDGRMVELGRFATIEEAAEARRLAELAPCTTFGSDCACNGPRVIVDPCPDCEGSGRRSDV
jgi:hypothetical protein